MRTFEECDEVHLEDVGGFGLLEKLGARLLAHLAVRDAAVAAQLDKLELLHVVSRPVHYAVVAKQLEQIANPLQFRVIFRV